jgi:hypothetical protein
MTEPNTQQPADGFVIIHVNKDTHSGPVRGGVNGRTYEVKVGSDQNVPAWVALSLRDTQIKFTIVAGDLGEDSGGAEGSAPSESETHTAIRGEESPLDGSGGTPMKASELSATPPLLGQVGGAQSGSAGQPPNASGSTQPPEGSEPTEFDAATFGDRTLSQITDEELSALSPEQRAAVRENETAKGEDKARKGLLDRLDALDQPKS